MERIQIELGKIKPNPFKKFINGGELNEETISKLMEGYKQTAFHPNLTARKNKDGEVELIYGHHRLEAGKRVYGKKYQIYLNVYDYNEFSDNNMLLDMIRENLTHRGDDYRDTADSIMLVKKWLEGDRTANLLYDLKKTHKKEVSIADISKFLSAQGKIISGMQVAKYLSIEDNLIPSIKKKVAIAKKGGKLVEDSIGLEVASEISKLEKSEQNIVAKKVEEAEINKDKAKRLINLYRNSPKEIKVKIKEGKIKLEKLDRLKILKKDFKAKDILQIFRSDALECEKLIQRTIKSLLICKKIMPDMDEQERNKMKYHISLWNDILLSGSGMAEEVLE